MNPFAHLQLPKITDRRPSSAICRADLECRDDSERTLTPKQIRDSVVLYLRWIYRLSPSEIVSLNTTDIDAEAGILSVPGRRRKQVTVLAARDLPVFRRWATIRRLYSQDCGALIISLHWTPGRSLPHQRISTRAVYDIVTKGLHEK